MHTDRNIILSIRHEQIDKSISTCFLVFLMIPFFDLKFDLLQTLVNPTSGIELTRWGLTQTSRNFFNSSILICEIERLSRANLFLKMFGEAAKKMTNFTLACPLPAGVYFLRFGMDELKRMFPGRLLYQQNTHLLVGKNKKEITRRLDKSRSTFK